MTQAPPSLWQQLIQANYLSLYEKTNPPTSVYYQGYDFVFEFESAIVYLLVNGKTLQVPDGASVDNKKLFELRKLTINEMIRRHAQLYLKNNTTHPKPSTTLTQQNSADTSAAKPIYFVGLTALAIEQQQKSFMVEHRYGSQFFAEECVLDLDDERRVLQIFSLPDFTSFIKQLESPSDLIVFLAFHREKLIAQQPYQDERVLLSEFLASPLFYKSAITVQEQLVAIGLLDNVEPRLLNASQDPTAAQTLSTQLQTNARMWYKLVNGLSKRCYQAGTPLPVEQVQMLISESMYTRSCIMEEVMAYAHTTPEQRAQGYIRHQHSYHAFGRHYMLVFFANDPRSELSAASVQEHYHDLLFEVNTQLQSPVMDDIFLLGFDFSHHDASGQTEVQMTAYHQSGAKISAPIQRLYEQIAQLKAQTPNR